MPGRSGTLTADEARAELNIVPVTDPHRCWGAVARLTATALVALTALGGAPTGQPTQGGTGAGRPVAAVPAARPDAVREEQWQIDALHAPTAWRYATGAGVVVAVVDSGVDAKHPDLVGQVLPGIDLVNGSGDGRTDPVGHGTTVAGLIAGRNDDDHGVVGIAPGAKILPVRVLDRDNRYDDAAIVAKGVRWAVDNGARVINLSLGGVGASPALAEALEYAFAKDVVVVACTGNVTPSAPTEVWYPAREPGVLAVAGLDHTNSDRLWPNSITGDETVLSAPANGLLGARPGGYWRVQGTSFASPLVAASAALVRSHWPRMSAANVVNRLILTAHDLGVAGRDDSFGFGAVDPAAALTATLALVDHNPLDGAPPAGVVGFGPAPGVVEEDATVARAADGAPNAAGGAAETKSAARATHGHSRTGLVTALAFFLALVIGGVLLFRRLDARTPHT
jgi:type VII secretion-associated serine protease mycosin